MSPYCAARGDRHMFLTEAQERYVQQYCERLNQALSDPKDGEHVIDMDAVADAAGKDVEKPPLITPGKSAKTLQLRRLWRIQRYPWQVLLLLNLRITQ